jgi:hypothetical protein
MDDQRFRDRCEAGRLLAERGADRRGRTPLAWFMRHLDASPR